MVNWKSPHAYERLLAALVAALDNKLDYRTIATYYGENATYDAIEGRFRIIKKQAAALKAEVENGERGPAPARNTGTTASSSSNANETTPKKPRGRKPAAGNTTTPKKEKIISGRVGKTTTPSKNAKVFKTEDDDDNFINGIKEDVVSSSSSYIENEADAVGEVDVPMNMDWLNTSMDGMNGFVGI